jgi:adenylate cyclase
VSFLVGENTYEKVAAIGHYRELDRIRVVGKQLPVRIYEPAGFSEGVDERMTERFNAALALYRERQWQAAADAFAEIRQQLPHDRPCEIYLERCAYFAKNPPLEDWDGVFNRDEK